MRRVGRVSKCFWRQEEGPNTCRQGHIACICRYKTAIIGEYEEQSPGLRKRSEYHQEGYQKSLNTAGVTMHLIQTPAAQVLPRRWGVVGKIYFRMYAICVCCKVSWPKRSRVLVEAGCWTMVTVGGPGHPRNRMEVHG